jgi:hypothetical protein
LLPYLSVFIISLSHLLLREGLWYWVRNFTINCWVIFINNLETYIVILFESQLTDNHAEIPSWKETTLLKTFSNKFFIFLIHVNWNYWVRVNIFEYYDEGYQISDYKLILWRKMGRQNSLAENILHLAIGDFI